MTFVGKWMELEITVLRKISQTRLRKTDISFHLCACVLEHKGPGDGRRKGKQDARATIWRDRRTLSGIKEDGKR